MSEQVRAKVAPAPGIKRKRHRWTRDDTELGLLGLPTFIWYVLFSYLHHCLQEISDLPAAVLSGQPVHERLGGI